MKDCGFEATRSKTFLEKFWFRIKGDAGGILDLVRDFLENIVSEANIFVFQARRILKKECWPNMFQPKRKQDFS